jgi:hypothetical protein
LGYGHGIVRGRGVSDVGGRQWWNSALSVFTRVLHIHPHPHSSHHRSRALDSIPIRSDDLNRPIPPMSCSVDCLLPLSRFPTLRRTWHCFFFFFLTWHTISYYHSYPNGWDKGRFFFLSAFSLSLDSSHTHIPTHAHARDRI